MRFVRFQAADGPPRFGALLADHAVADLDLLCGAHPEARGLPAGAFADVHAFIEAGEAAFMLADRLVTELNEERNNRLSRGGEANGLQVVPAGAYRLLAPLTHPRKFIAAGKNFREHGSEMGSWGVPELPVAFPQFREAITDPEAAIPYPPETEALDYEVELAIVIGKPAYRIGADKALGHVFGFTVFNDISARDLYRRERAGGIPLAGKNLPRFAPLGPVLVSRDEIEVPERLRLVCRVNGEIRQDGVLGDMVHPIEQLVSHWSTIGLDPGDIVTSGTPSGVAAGRKPGQTPWWLRPGDVVEAEIEGIGVLRNAIEASASGSGAGARAGRDMVAS